MDTNKTFSFPTLPTLYVTQKWGNVNASMYPAPTYRHMGVDIGGPVGAPIYAACDGVVADVNLTGAHGYGRHVIIQHLDGLYDTLYAHLHKVKVEIGDEVIGGQQIGEMGGQPGDDDPIDGASSGAHLHFEAILPSQPNIDFVKTFAGYTVDPLPYLTRLAHGEPGIIAKVIARKGLRVRSEASVDATQIGALEFGSIHPVVRLIDVGNDQWAQLWSLRPEFAAVRYGGEILMEVSAGTQPNPPPVPQEEGERAARLDEIQKMIASLEKRKSEL